MQGKDRAFTSGGDRRGEVVATIGMVISVAGAIVLALLAIASQNTSGAAWAAAFQLLGAGGVWLLTLIQVHQRRLVEEERFEIAELERSRREKLGGAGTIFEEEDLEQMDRLAMGRRLRTIERYLVPVVALLLAVYHAAAGLSILPWSWQFPPIARVGEGPVLEPMRLAIFSGAIAFICFMLSRYGTGMSRLKQWNVLCAGANFSFGSSAVCLAVGISLLCAGHGLRWVENWVGWAVGVLMIGLACETIINFLFDFYRPRVPGQRQRPFYDSRLLGMFSEPEGILRSLANAIDYQFGFKVSETWFYRLLGQAVVPLLIVQIAVIMALTCVVVVPPGHQAVIERWGRPLPQTAKPGIHFASIWPIDQATIIPVDRVRRMELGYAPEDEKERKQKEKDRLKLPILWTKEHFKQEYLLLVADRQAAADTQVPVNLLSMTVPVQWRVKADDAEVIRFHTQAHDAGAILESLAYRELTRYAAGADILDLLGERGIETAAGLKTAIQAACDHAGYDGQGLGVEIMYVGIGGVHPPTKEAVAAAYEEVVGAMERREAKIKEAQGDATKTRVTSAGTEWDSLYKAIVQEDEARIADSPALKDRSHEVDTILKTLAGGTARETVAGAELRTLARVFKEKSESERYAMQIAAYQAAPRTYLLRLFLRMLQDGLEDIRKYVVVLEDTSKLIYEIDLKPPQQLDILGAELSAAEAKQK